MTSKVRAKGESGASKTTLSFSQCYVHVKHNKWENNLSLHGGFDKPIGSCYSFTIFFCTHHVLHEHLKFNIETHKSVFILKGSWSIETYWSEHLNRNHAHVHQHVASMGNISWIFMIKNCLVGPICQHLHESLVRWVEKVFGTKNGFAIIYKLF